MTPLSTTGRPTQKIPFQDNSQSLAFPPTTNYNSYKPSALSPPLDLTQGINQQTSPNYNRDNPSEFPQHNTNNIVRFDCRFCGKQFQRQTYLRKHIQCRHPEQMQSEGIKCDSQTVAVLGPKVPYQTENFQQDSQPEATDKLTCRTCLKTFTNDVARVKHEVTAHGGDGVTCPTCRQTFVSRAALERHSRHAHATESFACKYCSLSFHSSRALTRHINKLHPTENRQVILLQLPVLKNRPC